MDINKPITNPEFVNVMRQINQGNHCEELFWKEIFKARFLCPVNMEIGKTTQNNEHQIVLEEETSASLISIRNKKGEHYLMAFTDWDELRKWKQDYNQQTLVLSYEDYQKMITKNNSVYQGMVINPFGFRN